MKNWKQNAFFGVVAIIVLGFGFVACDDGNEETFTVTIGTLTNGSIEANPTSRVEGTEITLTVNPDNWYRLKSASLKYGSTAINESTLKFNLPASNITISAVFESLFIGSWEQQNGVIWTFFENGIMAMQSTKSHEYGAKGTWVLQGANTAIVTATHNTNEPTMVLDDINNEINPPVEFTFTILTSTSVKYNDTLCTLIE